MSHDWERGTKRSSNRRRMTSHRFSAASYFAIGIMASLWIPGDAMAQPDLGFPLQAKRILFIGDSITHSGGFVAWIDGQFRLQDVAPRPAIINIGLSSETCSGLSEPDHPFPRPDIHERIERALKQTKPDVVVACYGMNDGIYYPFSQDRFQAYQQGIQRLIDRVHESGAKIVLLTPPPFDPLPAHDRLLPRGKSRYAYNAIFEGYDQVLKRYAAWIMKLDQRADLVIDIRTPMVNYTADKRKEDPNFTLTRDGIHPDSVGHRIMGETILKAWGMESTMSPSSELMGLCERRVRLLHDAWLGAIGHQHPRVKDGLALNKAKAQAQTLATTIAKHVVAARTKSPQRYRSHAGTMHQVAFPPTAQVGELSLAVDYFLWIPDNVKRIRGIIVHQHGCGPGASLGGRTAAEDLHWQALAQKWDCALLGSSYEPKKGINCRLWCDARRGSADRFLQGLDALAKSSGHPEVAQVPWCLWGHSGGGFWSSLMQTLYPNRIVAIWFRSGTAHYAWNEDQIPRPQFPESMFKIPMMANPGLKEKDKPLPRRAWNGLTDMHRDYLKRGAVFFKFAPDPNTGHECGDSRYLAIPYFDFWLTHRLPENSDLTGPLRQVTPETLAAWDRTMQPKLEEFVLTGAVADSTAPPAPEHLRIQRNDNGTVTLRWTANADIESGLGAFEIERDGKSIGRVPAKPVGRFGRPLFQGMSYHDTPQAPLPKMEFVDRDAPSDREPDYRVRAINTANLKSH